MVMIPRTWPLRATLLLTAATFCIAGGLLVMPVSGTEHQSHTAPFFRTVNCGTVLKHAEREVLFSQGAHARMPVDINNPPCNQLIVRRAWAISSAMAGVVILFGGLVLSNERVRILSRSVVCRTIAPLVALALPASMIPMSLLLRSGYSDGLNLESTLLLPIGMLAVLSQVLITSASPALPSPRRVPLVLGFSLLIGAVLAIGMLSNIIEGFEDR